MSDYPRNCNWNIPHNLNDPNYYSFEKVQCAVLLDIREELRNLNALLSCENFTDIPSILRRIRANTYKKRPKKKSGRKTV